MIPMLVVVVLGLVTAIGLGALLADPRPLQDADHGLPRDPSAPDVAMRLTPAEGRFTETDCMSDRR